uniref:DUF4939 domain-containing protein n=1 Tax=Peromyscus maniculatus bairdii TaxID=230844 RepID=A0A8C8UHV2_PERMB
MQNKNKATDAPLTPNFRLQQNSIQFPELLDGDMEPFLKFIVQMDTCMLVNNKTFSNKLKVMFLTTCLKGPVLQWRCFSTQSQLPNPRLAFLEMASLIGNPGWPPT